MKLEYLPFERCLRRLEHSFLRTFDAYFGTRVAFQHPSLRDMLLTFLQKQPAMRRTYMRLVAPEGLPELIEGVPEGIAVSTESEHTLVVQNDDEVELLAGRIERVLNDSMQPSSQEGLLLSGLALAWRSDTSVGKRRFTQTWRGQIIQSILRGVASRTNYEANAYSFHNWTVMMGRFYKLTVYIAPRIHPQFLPDLAGRLTDASYSDRLKFLYILSRNRKRLFEKAFDSEQAAAWNEEFEAELEELYEQGDHLNAYQTDDKEEYEELSDEYAEWVERSEKALEIADLRSAIPEMDEIVENAEYDSADDLRDLKWTADPPCGPEEDEDSESGSWASLPSQQEYWTLERLLEDL